MNRLFKEVMMLNTVCTVDGWSGWINLLEHYKTFDEADYKILLQNCD